MAETITKVQGEVVETLPKEKQEVAKSVVSGVSTIQVNTQTLPELEQVTGVTCREIDFNNTDTIMYFGSEITNYVGQLLIDTANMSVNQEQQMLSEDDLRAIISFDDYLEQSKIDAAKKEGLLARLIKGIGKAAGSEAAQKADDLKTYQGQYNEYNARIDRVCDVMQTIGQNAYADIQLRKEIAMKMIPANRQLGLIIEEAWKTKEAFDAETKAMAENPNPDAQLVVSYRTNMSTFLESKLIKLGEVQVAYRQKIQEYSILQFNDMQACASAADFIQNDKPILQANGSTTVYSNIQTDRLDQLYLAHDAVKLALQSGAKRLRDNTESAVEVMKNGRITSELEIVQGFLQESVSIIRESKKELAVLNQKDKETLDKLADLLNQNDEEILNLVQESAAAMLPVNEFGTSSRNGGSRIGSLSGNQGNKSHKRSLLSSSTDTRNRK
ncbi:MAG: hypothetical protein J1F35_02150 [Erysipelotrichales bacterium]|nr:hypothetical protein [Erysipelotrichales bacterium]